MRTWRKGRGLGNSEDLEEREGPGGIVRTLRTVRTLGAGRTWRTMSMESTVRT